MQIELEQEDFETLLSMAGMALSVAIAQKDRSLMQHFLDVANKINANNPDWTPYGLPAAEEQK